MVAGVGIGGVGGVIGTNIFRNLKQQQLEEDLEKATATDLKNYLDRRNRVPGVRQRLEEVKAQLMLEQQIKQNLLAQKTVMGDLDLDTPFSTKPKKKTENGKPEKTDWKKTENDVAGPVGNADGFKILRTEVVSEFIF